MSTYADPNGCKLPSQVWDDILDDDCRRWVLNTLAERGDPVVVADMATDMVSASTVQTPEDRDAVERELFERHLPKLTAADIVNYNPRLGTIELVKQPPSWRR